MSREKILNDIKAAQPAANDMPDVPVFEPWFNDTVLQFVTVATTIGSEVHMIGDHENIISIIKNTHTGTPRIITAVESLAALADTTVVARAHDYESVDLYVIETTLAVAENGAVWITENDIGERVLPFIAQHLAVIVPRQCIVPTMHDAYNTIGNSDYGFAAFIAGPSKTADIEQSLVLGAHGPKSMTLFII
jgi:L-lactate dehydrogenase complex protein LldG